MDIFSHFTGCFAVVIAVKVIFHICKTRCICKNNNIHIFPAVKKHRCSGMAAVAETADREKFACLIIIFINIKPAQTAPLSADFLGVIFFGCVKYLADMQKMSVDCFRHKFKKLYNIPPLQYYNEIKLQKIKQLICQSEHTLTQIAEMTGFSDLNYFSRFF